MKRAREEEQQDQYTEEGVDHHHHQEEEEGNGGDDDDDGGVYKNKKNGDTVLDNRNGSEVENEKSGETATVVVVVEEEGDDDDDDDDDGEDQSSVLTQDEYDSDDDQEGSRGGRKRRRTEETASSSSSSGMENRDSISKNSTHQSSSSSTSFGQQANGTASSSSSSGVLAAPTHPPVLPTMMASAVPQQTQWFPSHQQQMQYPYQMGYQQQQHNRAHHRQQKHPQRDLSDTNLFVNFLPPYYGDAELQQLFSPFGEILASKVMINLTTKQSRGFGFVEFKSSESASAAIAAMNGFRIDNKVLQVKFAQVKVEAPTDNLGTPNTNVYMTGLPYSVDKNQLQQVFSRFGKVEDCIVIIDYKTQQSRGVGFCRFSTLDEAKRAIDECQGRTDVFPGQTQKLELKYANEKKGSIESSRGNRFKQRSTHNQAMSYPVMPHMQAQAQAQAQQQFMEYMTQFYASMYGYTPEQVVQMYGMHAFGAIPPGFQQQQQLGVPPVAAAAAAAGGVATIMPGTLGVPAVPSAGSTNRIIVYNLPEDASKPFVINLLKPYGYMPDVQVMPDANNRNSKYAMVTFANPSSASKAVQKLQQFKLGSRTITAAFIP